MDCHDKTHKVCLRYVLYCKCSMSFHFLLKPQGDENKKSGSRKTMNPTKEFLFMKISKFLPDISV